MTGLPVTDLETAAKAVTTLRATGTRCIVLTLGEKGLLYTVRKAEDSAEWSPVQHMETEKVNVVDTTVSLHPSLPPSRVCACHQKFWFKQTHSS